MGERWEEEEFAREMADLELKEEEEWKVQEEEEHRVWEAVMHSTEVQAVQGT